MVHLIGDKIKPVIKETRTNNVLQFFNKHFLQIEIT